jgi:mercuric reductase
VPASAGSSGGRLVPPLSVLSTTQNRAPESTLAIKVGLTIETLTSTYHPYLTLSDGIKLARQAFTKDVARVSCCAA